MQARLYLEEAVQLKPDYAEAYHNLGWVLLDIRDRDDQIVNFREILSAYNKATDYYLQQKQLSLVHDIQQIIIYSKNNFL